MATIANLDINLGAKVGGFEKGMKTAGKSIETVGQAITRLNKVEAVQNKIAMLKSGGSGGKFIAMAKGIAVAAATALAAKFSFGVFISAFERLDALNKSSSTLGIATERLSALHLAADMGGVSIEAMEKAIFKSGLTLDEFASAADAIASIENIQERNAAATKLFGKAAQELMPLLSQGGDVVRQAQANIDKFGFTPSNVETAGIEIALDKLSLLSLSLQGLIDKIAVEAAPIVAGLADWFLEGGINAASMGQTIEQAMDIAQHVIAGAASAWQIFMAPIKLIGAAVLNMVSGILDAWAALERVGKKAFGKKADFGIEAGAEAAARKLETFSMDLWENAAQGFNDAISGRTYTDLLGKFEANRKLARDTATDFTKPRTPGGTFEQEKAIGPAAALERGTSAAASAILKGRKAVTDGEKLTHKALAKTNELIMRLVRQQADGTMLQVAEL